MFINQGEGLERGRIKVGGNPWKDFLRDSKEVMFAILGFGAGVRLCNGFLWDFLGNFVGATEHKTGEVVSVRCATQTQSDVHWLRDGSVQNVVFGSASYQHLIDDITNRLTDIVRFLEDVLWSTNHLYPSSLIRLYLIVPQLISFTEIHLSSTHLDHGGSPEWMGSEFLLIEPRCSWCLTALTNSVMIPFSQPLVLISSHPQAFPECFRPSHNRDKCQAHLRNKDMKADYPRRTSKVNHRMVPLKCS